MGAGVFLTEGCSDCRVAATLAGWLAGWLCVDGHRQASGGSHGFGAYLERVARQRYRRRLRLAQPATDTSSPVRYAHLRENLKVCVCVCVCVVA
jgi:hypothetical protein